MTGTISPGRASFALVGGVPPKRFQICLSVALYAEWQDVLTRVEHLPAGQTADDALAFLRYLASHAWLQDIYFLWRPFLPNPGSSPERCDARAEHR